MNKNIHYLPYHCILVSCIVFFPTLTNAMRTFSPNYIDGDEEIISKKILKKEQHIDEKMFFTTILSSEGMGSEIKKRTKRKIKRKELSPIGEPYNFTPEGLPPSNKSLYQITPYAAVFSQEDMQEENHPVYKYYHIALEGLFTPDPDVLEPVEMHTCHTHHRHHRVSSYTLTATLIEEEGEHPAVPHIFKSSPPSTQGTSSITSGIEFGVNGSIGFPSGGTIGSSLSVNHSRTYNIDDLEIECEHTNKKVQWKFIINNLNDNINKTSKLSKSTFNPYVQWVWRVKDSKKPLKFKIDFTTSFKEKGTETPRIWTYEQDHSTILLNAPEIKKN